MLAIKNLTQSVRIWHIAPLCLPLFLGSTNVQQIPPASAPIVAASLTNAQLLAKQGITVSPSQSAVPAAQTSISLPEGTKAQHQSLAYQSQQKSLAMNSAAQSQVDKTKAKTAIQPTRAPQVDVAVAAAPKPARNLPPIPIRVAVAVDAPTLAVATSDAGVVADQNGRILGTLTPQTAIAVAPSAAGLQIGAWQASPVAWIKARSTDGLIYVGSHWFRGSVQLLQTPQGLLAVNHTDVETYLGSVVGSEMPAYWPIEALKAQAVAARSYAIVHIARPASEYYDLGATPRWQAYTGVEAETNTTQAAVSETRGILLSYGGGVVESLYASSDQLVKDAHSGFGMSQEGASQLAQQNMNYRQILGRFYPGTGLAVLDIK